MSEQIESAELARFKRKYYRLLDDLAQQDRELEHVQDGLYDALNRLSTLATGWSESLDPHIRGLRDAIRKRAPGERLVRLIATAGEQLDTGRGDESPANESSKSGFFERLRPARYAAPPPPEPTVHKPMVDWQAIKAEIAEQLPGGGIEEAFATLAPDEPAALVSTLLDQVRGCLSRDSAAQAAGALREALTRLLDAVEIPKSLAERAGSLRDALCDERGDFDPRQSIGGMADLIADARQAIARGRDDLERFLAQVLSKLGDIDARLANSSAHAGSLRQASDGMQQSVAREMDGIRGDVVAAHDLTDLRSAMDKRLSAIDAHMHQFQDSQSEVLAAAEQETEALRERLSQVEADSLALRQRLVADRQRALRDVLTGVHNRMALEEHMGEELARWERYGYPLSVAFWDIDRFKAVNDTYGHATGDRVLKAVAGLLAREVRETDFVARYGGEEFVVVMAQTDASDALKVAEKIRMHIQRAHFNYAGQRVLVTASCGVAQCRPGDTAETVYARADQALYAAKHGGRNQCRLEQSPGRADAAG